MNKKERPEGYTTGRPTTYREEYCEKIIQHFEKAIAERDNDNSRFPTFEAFAHSIDVHTDTLQEWRSVHPKFSVAYKRAKQLQQTYWIEGSMESKFNPAFTIFAGKNLFGWRDKHDVDVGGKKDKPLKWQVEIVGSKTEKP